MHYCRAFLLGVVLAMIAAACGMSVTPTPSSRFSVERAATHTPRPATATRMPTRVYPTATGVPSPTATKTPRTMPANHPSGAGLVPAEVVSVVDGDRMEVRLEDGAVIGISLIGIDAPAWALCYGRESAQHAIDLINSVDALVWLEGEAQRDANHDLPREVWLETPGGHVLLNLAMVADGYAIAKDTNPNSKYAGEIAAAGEIARAEGRGFWGVCGAFPVEPTPVPPATATTAPQPTAPPARSCDPAYPTICIDPNAPDLDCADIPQWGNFKVLPPDPHFFDADFDGYGCEWN